MPSGAPLGQQPGLYDADRIGELLRLLGANEYWRLLAMLRDELGALNRTVLSGNDTQRVAATLHRLQGSASALGLIETSAGVVRAANQFAADFQSLPQGQCLDLLSDRLVESVLALTRSEKALADAYPGLREHHGRLLSKQ